MVNAQAAAMAMLDEGFITDSIDEVASSRLIYVSLRIAHARSVGMVNAGRGVRVTCDVNKRGNTNGNGDSNGNS